MRTFFLLSLLAVVLVRPSTAFGVERRYLEPGETTGTSQAVVVDSVSLAHTAQLLPLDAGGRLVGKGDPAAQAEKVLDHLGIALTESKSGLDRLVKLNVYAANQQAVDEVKKVLAKRFRGEVKPAVSFVVGTLPHADALVAMDAVAVAGLDPQGTVKLLRSAQLPGGKDSSHVAVLPAGTRVYVSGQAEKGNNLAEATRLTLESLRATLKYLELNDGHIVQLKMFMTPMTGLAEVEKEIAKFFAGRTLPPLVFVEWSSTLPIEIELIAHGGTTKNRDGAAIEYLTPPNLKDSPVFSRIARLDPGPTIYVAGLYGTKGKDAPAEIEEIFATLQRLTEKAGSDLKHLAKATYYVSTDEASKKLNELRPRWYDPKRPPAASKAVVRGVGMEGKGITVDMIAVPAGRK